MTVYDGAVKNKIHKISNLKNIIAVHLFQELIL